MNYILCLLLLFIPSVVLAGEKRESDLSMMLFPETTAWIDITNLPRVTEAWLDRWKWKLRFAYLENSPGKPLETSSCSFITKALYEGDATANLYLADIDTDGILDVVYVGSAHCLEGDLTIIWHGSKTKTGDWTVSEHKPDILQVRGLKILPAPEPKISSVIVGCCSDPVDQYLVGYIFNPYRLHRLNVLHDLAFPVNFLPGQERVILSTETVLRSSPDESNDFKESTSSFIGHAVFGNILRKYLPGVEALVLARLEQSHGAEWAFVIVSESNDRFVYHSPYSVNVGWVKTNTAQK